MRNIVIYGTGIYGRRVYESLKRLKCINVDMFLVTKKDANDKIENVPIYDISDIGAEQLDESKVIVAVDERYHNEIKKTVLIHFGEKIIDNFIFFKKCDVDRLYRHTHKFEIKNFLSSVEPVSRLFGNERGTPVDRIYIERFIEKESKKILECEYSLEVGEDIYSQKFFPKSIHDILDYSKGMDLTKIETLPENKYDVFICTQVFHQIYDVRSAIKGAYHLLKKGGVLLATVCGNITKLARNDEYDHYWGFTRHSIELLVKEVFNNIIEIESYGNIAVATAFIQGIAAEEMNNSIFDFCDEDFSICISIKAIK